MGPVRARAARDDVVAEIGADAMVAVRTDRIQLSENRPSSVAGDEILPTAVVLGSAYNGAHIDIVLELEDGQHLTVRSYSGDDPPERGSQTYLVTSVEAVLTEVIRPEPGP
jgi:hypothetical protein